MVGVGPILGLTILLETGTVERFKNVGSYASYCRCVQSLRESNGKKRGKVMQRVATNISHGRSRKWLMLLCDSLPKLSRFMTESTKNVMA